MDDDDTLPGRPYPADWPPTTYADARILVRANGDDLQPGWRIVDRAGPLGDAEAVLVIVPDRRQRGS